MGEAIKPMTIVEAPGEKPTVSAESAARLTRWAQGVLDHARQSAGTQAAEVAAALDKMADRLREAK